MATLRRARVEWRQGAYQTLTMGEDWLAFARFTDRDATIVAVNRGPECVVHIPLQMLPLSVEHWHEASGHAFEKRSGGISFTLGAADLRIVMSGRRESDG